MSRLLRLYERTKDSLGFKRKAARALVTADLRILIANANKTQKEVAEKLGVSAATLSAKLSGEKNLTLDSITDIAAALGKSYDIIFRDAGAARWPQEWEAPSMFLHIQERLEDAFAPCHKAGDAQEISTKKLRIVYDKPTQEPQHRPSPTAPHENGAATSFAAAA